MAGYFIASPIDHIHSGQQPGCRGVAQGFPGGYPGVGLGNPEETPVNGARISVKIR
jgi:hypothetical protein